MFNAIKVCIYVDNQERAIEFYTKKLGFEVAVTHSMGPQGNWVELVHNRGQLRLVPYPRSMMPDWQERKPSIVFSCEDVSALYEELSARGGLLCRPAAQRRSCRTRCGPRRSGCPPGW